MPIIKNFDSLATSTQRRAVLDIIEAGLSAIDTEEILKQKLRREKDTLYVGTEKVDLGEYERIFLIGFGKGSANASSYIESVLGQRLTTGYVIDNAQKTFTKLKFSLGTHPLPSETNLTHTKNVLANIKNLTSRDLVLVVICGGGSAMFEYPHSVNLPQLIEIFETLIKSGATIEEINKVRKHLSAVKGGALAAHLYPARIVGVIFSDVASNDLSVIASGPISADNSSLSDVWKVLNKYNLASNPLFSRENFKETPRSKRIFNSVTPVIILSNETALYAMKNKAEALNLPVRILSHAVSGSPEAVAELLINSAREKGVLLAAGETTLKIKGNGKGGRNQALVLSSLSKLPKNQIIAAIDSDGLDFYRFAGAIADASTLVEADQLGLDPNSYLDNNDSGSFFEKVKSGIETGKLQSNVADLYIILTQ